MRKAAAGMPDNARAHYNLGQLLVFLQLHVEAKTAWEFGATEEQMNGILIDIRHAQWRWDWVAAANGLGFHAPHEALRVMGTAIEKAERARVNHF